MGRIAVRCVEEDEEEEGGARARTGTHLAGISSDLGLAYLCELVVVLPRDLSEDLGLLQLDDAVLHLLAVRGQPVLVLDTLQLYDVLVSNALLLLLALDGGLVALQRQLDHLIFELRGER